MAAAEDVFATSRGLFEQVTADLAGPETAVMTHSQLEDMLSARMREVTRALFQDHMNLRALTEARVPDVVDADGIERTRIEHGRTRILATVFGKVTATRIAYRGTGVPDLHPADAALNMPAGMHSPGVAKLAAIEAARGSFAEASERVNVLTGAGVGHRQVQELAIATAVDIDAFYDALIPAPCTAATLLVMSVDGKGVVIRPEALREATAKAAAAKGGNKLDKRLSAGEKNGRKRMATLGTVYDAEPAVRGVDDIIADPDPDPDLDLPADGPDDGGPGRLKGPAARSKWLCGSVDDTAAEVIAAVFDQAQARDSEHLRTWVVLVDGAPHQIDLINAEAAARHVTVHIVIDIIHVLEYAWTAAHALHETGDKTIETWVARLGRTILAGDSGKAAAQVRQAAEQAGIAAGRNKGIDDTVAYLTNKADYLHYDTALAAGWPIATGIIEGACRHLVKDRLDITGARWGLAGAEAVLKLRALRSNGDFDTYWAWHEQQEFTRNHQARYRNTLIPAA
ncbi:ISKra4 family transposase [Streptomyces sp. NRRL S-1824]|uniref:ISKra4 family transposase n=1 Tax=Streptomyces sp. NRRL S-1824 TaxID=1463889 RepID=UPI000560128A|nr:ISKra4 family transposase [Streptomyces sp. NRRL S-1824]